MTDEQTYNLYNARTLVSAAMRILQHNLTDDPQALPDQIASLLDKAATDLRELAETR